MERHGSNMVLIISDDELILRETVLQFKLAAPAHFFYLMRSYQEAFRLSQGEMPNLILFDLSQKSEAICSFVEKMSECFHEAKIIGLGQLQNADLVVKLVKAGMKDFLKFPIEQREIRTLLGHAEEHAASKAHQGRMVTVFSPKGGAGVTLLTSNLGVALSKKKTHAVAVCDLSPQCGDVTTYLNVHPEYTIRDLIDNYQRLDLSFLKGVLLRHESGFHILASPRDDQESLHAGCLTELQTIFTLLKQTHDIVLIDGSHTDNTLLQLALMQSDLIFLVANLDVPSLKGLVFSLNKLTKLHYTPDRIKIVMNRTNSKRQLDVKEFEKKTRHSVACRLPNNYALCIEAINTGQPLLEIQSQSELTKKIGDLASLIEDFVGNGQIASHPSGFSKMEAPGIAAAVKGFVKCLF